MTVDDTAAGTSLTKPAVLRSTLNVARQHAIEELHHRSIPGIGSTVGRASPTRFRQLLTDRPEDVVFVHAGLRDIKQAFDRNPYRFLLDVLDDGFESILVPGYTPSFRQTGVYHPIHSTPEFGAFAKSFLSDAEARTDDAIHSILIRGPYRFDDCDQTDTFGPNGCWAKLDADNVLNLNVGTHALVSTHHHYVEHACQVPYNRVSAYEGVRVDESGSCRPWTQRNYTYDRPARRRPGKVERTLEEAGVIDRYDCNGLTIRCFRARDLRLALEPKIDADPYFLIT